MDQEQHLEETFPVRLKRWRVNSRWPTQELLAAEISVLVGRTIKHNQISGYERAKRPIAPKPDVIEALKCLGFQLSDLNDLEREGEQNVKNYAYLHPRGRAGEEYGDAVLKVPASFPSEGCGGLICVTEALMPFIHPGDTLVFLDTITPRRDKVFAFKRGGDLPPDARELIFEEKEFQWRSWNDKAEEIPYRKQDLLGMLIGVVGVNGGITLGPIMEGMGSDYFEQISSLRFGR